MRTYPHGYGGYSRRRGGRGLRLVVGLIVAGLSLVSYLSSKTENEITGETQYIDLTPSEEIALGVQAAPTLLRRYGGGEVDPRLRAYVSEVGERLAQRSTASRSPYRFQFHVLDDPKTVNAFALPGGQIFITTGLLSRLGAESQLAGVLGHEIGHVVGRHGAEHLAKAKLSTGLTTAFVIGADDPRDPYDTQRNAMIAAYVGNLVSLKYGRADELESDALGVRFMAEAGYDPEGMLGLMRVLAQSGGGGRAPEFFSTHPNPENRLARLEGMIQKLPRGGEVNGEAYQRRALSLLR